MTKNQVLLNRCEKARDVMRDPANAERYIAAWKKYELERTIKPHNLQKAMFKLSKALQPDVKALVNGLKKLSAING